MTEWQPIETAPTKGRILVFNPFFGVYSSQFTVEYEPTEAFLPRAQQKVGGKATRWGWPTLASAGGTACRPTGNPFPRHPKSPNDR